MKAKLFSLLICSLPVSAMAFGVTIDSIAKQKDAQTPTPPIGTRITLPAAFGNVNSITISKEFNLTPSQQDLYKAVAAEFTSAQYYPNQISITEFANNATSTTFTALPSSPAYVIASFITVKWTYSHPTLINIDSLLPAVTPEWDVDDDKYEFNAHPIYGGNLDYDGTDLSVIRSKLNTLCPSLYLNQVTLTLIPSSADPQYVAVNAAKGSNMYKGGCLVPLNANPTPLENIVPINMDDRTQDNYICQSSGDLAEWKDYAVFNGTTAGDGSGSWHYNAYNQNPPCPIPTSGFPRWEYNGIQLPVAKTAMFYSFAGRWGNWDSSWQTPTSFDLLATNDVSPDFDWGKATVLDSRRNQPVGTQWSYRYYSFANTTPFLRYRLAIYSTRPADSTDNIYPIMSRIMFWGF